MYDIRPVPPLLHILWEGNRLDEQFLFSVLCDGIFLCQWIPSFLEAAVFAQDRRDGITVCLQERKGPSGKHFS